MSRLKILGLALLALSLLGLLFAPTAFHAAWLVAWWFCLGVVLGALSTGWVHRLTGGAWGRAAAPAISALAGRLPWVLIAALPWLLALPALYAWAASMPLRIAPDFHAAEPGFKQAWLSPGFFLLRMAVYALSWWMLSRLTPGTHRPKGTAAAALLAHAFLTSLAAVDIVMSLMPRWYSTGFGLVLLVSQGMAGCAMVICLSPAPTLSHVPAGEPGAHRAPAGRDLGNLLLMYVMAWGYLAFMQFLIIWAENLPNEIAWYLPRTQTAWRWVTVALVVLQLGLPLLALLFRAVKDDPARLKPLAGLVLLAHGLYCLWLVLPSLPSPVSLAWAVPLSVLTVVGMSLLLFTPHSLREGNHHVG